MKREYELTIVKNFIKEKVTQQYLGDYINLNNFDIDVFLEREEFRSNNMTLECWFCHHDLHPKFHIRLVDENFDTIMETSLIFYLQNKHIVTDWGQEEVL